MEAVEHFNIVRQSAVKILNKVKDQWETEWFILGEVIYIHKVQSQSRAWHIRGLLSVVDL